MKKRKLPLPAVLGLCLIGCSLGLMVFFQLRIHLGIRSSRQALEKLTPMIPDRTVGVPGNYAEPLMPVLEIDGSDYVAVLEIPTLAITLPVADQWTGGKLYRSPVRFCGSAYDGTLVIGGADVPSQFSFCDQIDTGVEVIITDMTGAQFTYAVSRIDRSREAQTQWLSRDDYDLTLFCRDQYNMDYLAVRCLLTYR